MAVHTETSIYQNLIRDNECVVAPLIEVNTTCESPSEDYILSIPHCIADSNLWKLLKVRKHVRKVRKANDNRYSKKKGHCKKCTSFTVHDKFIKVQCKDFSLFTCTICKQVCQSTVLAFVFAKLRNWTHNQTITTVDVRTFLCSYLYNIEDYRQVILCDSCGLILSAPPT